MPVDVTPISIIEMVCDASFTCQECPFFTLVRDRGEVEYCDSNYTRTWLLFRHGFKPVKRG